MPQTTCGLPPDMMPREKLIKHGPAALSDTELLALFLRTGVAGKNVFQLASEMLQRFRGFAGLIRANAQELSQFKGMGGTAKRAQLIGVLEMARRAMTQELQEQPVMNTPKLVKSFLQIELGALTHETFAVLFLDNQNRLLSYETMFRGSLTQTMVYPREIAKVALSVGANGVVLAHNHPSGKVEPSRSDLELTDSLRHALSLIDVHIRDHIIVAHGQSFSMAEAGLI
jgi:DNA repair protein RadC